ncbi:phage tail assembly protein [Kineococcus esterisolvens]|uniref:phage tail assembly protein n=1 Tax=unclassified Kineococcus TaxID=2621656 RepID=UPI003D7E0C2D
MASFSLDDIRSAAEARYASTDIDLGGGKTVSLVNPLRLSKAKRDRFRALQEDLTRDVPEGEEGPDQEEILKDVFRVVAQTEAQAERLIKALDGDLAQMVLIFERYGEETQPGEASASQD